jgi:anaerobic magnesium-protoporphyrin IX monomethyl ester cyclase
LIAVESAAPEILARMNKKISFELVVEKCRLIKKYGFEVGTFWIFGHPGETEETARKSLDAMVYLWENDLNDKQEIAMFTPYPGLPLLNDPEKEGFRLRQKDFSKYSRFDGPVIDLATITNEKMSAIYKEAREASQYWLSFKRDLFADTIDKKRV